MFCSTLCGRIKGADSSINAILQLTVLNFPVVEVLVLNLLVVRQGEMLFFVAGADSGATGSGPTTGKTC